MGISHLFHIHTTSCAGACLLWGFSVIFDRSQLVCQVEDFNSQWLAICCYSVVPDLSKGSSNFIWSHTVRKFNFHLSGVPGSVADCINVNPSPHMEPYMMCKTCAHKRKQAPSLIGISGGVSGVLEITSPPWGGRDIFWNCTLILSSVN